MNSVAIVRKPSQGESPLSSSMPRAAVCLPRPGGSVSERAARYEGFGCARTASALDLTAPQTARAGARPARNDMEPDQGGVGAAAGNARRDRGYCRGDGAGEALVRGSCSPGLIELSPSLGFAARLAQEQCHAWHHLRLVGPVGADVAWRRQRRRPANQRCTVPFATAACSSTVAAAVSPAATLTVLLPCREPLLALTVTR